MGLGSRGARPCLKTHLSESGSSEPPVSDAVNVTNRNCFSTSFVQEGGPPLSPGGDGSGHAFWLFVWLLAAFRRT